MILAVGAIALALVLARHARLQAAHELTQSHRRVIELKRDLARVRARLAEHPLPPIDPAPAPESSTAQAPPIAARQGRAQ